MDVPKSVRQRPKLGGVVEARGGEGGGSAVRGKLCLKAQKQKQAAVCVGAVWGRELLAVGSWVEDREGEVEPNLSLLPGGMDVNSALLI